MAKRSSDLTRGDERGTDIEKRSGDEADVLDLSGADTADETLSASAADDASDQTDQIKADRETTRANMGETIDAIQERLSFANIRRAGYRAGE